jgi:hypothetical protein
MGSEIGFKLGFWVGLFIGMASVILAWAMIRADAWLIRRLGAGRTPDMPDIPLVPTYNGRSKDGIVSDIPSREEFHELRSGQYRSPRPDDFEAI